MKSIPRLLCILTLLLVFTGIASAGVFEPGPFTTTGYTTNLVPVPFYPYLVPSEFGVLPGGYAKFHIRARGMTDGSDDALCRAFYGKTCRPTCLTSMGQDCGVSGFFRGVFDFDEWAVVDAMTLSGANRGVLTVTDALGQATIRFGGASDTAGRVAGAFKVLGGTGEYTGLTGRGAFSGTAGYVFTVDYATCGASCPVCAAGGEGLTMEKKEVRTRLSNDGAGQLTIGTILVFWPEANGRLEKVKFGGKTIFEPATPLRPPFARIDAAAGWNGQEEFRRLAPDMSAELQIKFENDVSPNQWDHTILVEFAEGCAVPFAAFPPAP